MLKKIYCSLALVCLLTGTLCAADDAFCGKWKLNMEKSQFTGDQIKIKDLGGNKYEWTVGNRSDNITYDGTDQPVHFGRTISMVPEGTNNWKMVIKKDGRVLSSMTHTISDDGKTQTIKGTETKPDGTTSDFNVVWKKAGGGSGWGGTWESADVKFTSPDERDIEAYESDGLTFNTPAYQDKLSMKFDGKDYPVEGKAPGGFDHIAIKKVNDHTYEVSQKREDKVVGSGKATVAKDGKTTTVTLKYTNTDGKSVSTTSLYEKQ